MLRTAFLALSAIACLTAPGRSQLAEQDPLYYGFYQELALGSFDEALALYDAFLESEAARRPPAERVEALLGRARCLQATGRRDAARAALEAVLAADPENREARAALQAGSDTADDAALELHLQALVEQLGGPQREQAARDLRLVRGRAVPYLAAGLASRHVGVVKGSADLLCDLDHPDARAALAQALRTPDEGLVPPVVAALSGLRVNPATLPVWEAALALPDDDLRRQATIHLWTGRFELAYADPAVQLRLLEAGARDPAPAVRELVLSYWPAVYRDAEVLPAAVPIYADMVVRGLSSPSADERAAATEVAWSVEPIFQSHRERLLETLDSSDPDLRDEAGKLALRVLARGWLEPEAAREVLLSLLESPNKGHREAAWEHLVAAVEATQFPWPEGLNERALARVIANIAEFAPYRLDGGFSGGGFERLIRLPLTASDHVELYLAVDLTPELETDEKEHFRRQCLGLLEAGLAARPERTDLVDDAFARIPTREGKLDWIEFWSKLRPPVPAWKAYQRACSPAEPASLRAAGYAALDRALWWHADERPATLELPELVDDVLDGGSDAAELFQALFDEELRTRLRGRMPARGQRQRAYGLGVLATALGPASLEGHLAEVQGLPGEQPALLEGFLEGLGAGLWWEDAVPLWRGLVELAAERAELIDPLLDAARLERLEQRACEQLVALALERHVDEVDRALTAAGQRYLELPLELFAPYLQDPSEHIRSLAGTAVDRTLKYRAIRDSMAGFPGSSRAATIATIRSNLDSPEPVRRVGAAYAVAALGDPAGIPWLLELLSDPDPDVRTATLESLRSMATRPPESPVEPAGSDR